MHLGPLKLALCIKGTRDGVAHMTHSLRNTALKNMLSASRKHLTLDPLPNASDLICRGFECVYECVLSSAAYYRSPGPSQQADRSEHERISLGITVQLDWCTDRHIRREDNDEVGS